MMIKFLEKNHIDLRSLESVLCLNKQIIVGDYTEDKLIPGHYVDYLDSEISYVTLRTEKDTRLMLWENHTFLENCHDNFMLNVHLKLLTDNLIQFLEVKKLEAWCARNNITIHKSKDEAHLTYYFTLLDAHKITGELLISPLLYFANNPWFTLQTDSDVLSQFFKVPPMVVDVKKDQMICFDKYHYQMAYQPDVNFIRVRDVHRNH
jgi:hypothetical protein